MRQRPDHCAARKSRSIPFGAGSDKPLQQEEVSKWDSLHRTIRSPRPSELLRRPSRLVSTGKSFNLEGPYDFASHLEMDAGRATKRLLLSPKNRTSSTFFCLSSYAFPKNRVEWGLQILEQALHKLTSSERSSGEAPIQEEPVCRRTGT